MCAAGEEVVEYMGPRPPVGIHRYVLVLFEQKTRVHAEGPGERANFNTRAFAAAHELGLPTAVVYFNAQKEPANRRRYLAAPLRGTPDPCVCVQVQPPHCRRLRMTGE